MNGLLVLLLLSWISCAVSEVKVQDSGSTAMANPNSNYRLSCTVSGNDTFNSWKNPKGVVVHNSSGFEYETSGDEHKLKILRLEVEDGGVWTCLSNEGNNDTITLHILLQKYGMTSLKQNLVKGSTGMVEVNLKGFPQPTFDWKKDGKRIPQIPRYKVAENGSLLISNVNISDSGTYSGVASQGGMDVDLDTIVVNVIAPPTFNSLGVEENRTLGGNITMECNVSGIPDPEIHWKKDSRLISPDPRLLITDNGLTIRNILATDNGTYTCVANNSAGTKGQVSILHVLVPPELPTLRDRKVEKGEDLKVYCNASSGNPSPEVTWTRNGSVLPNSQQIRYDGGSLLTIKNVQPVHSGTYECSARNGAVDQAGRQIVTRQLMKFVVIYPPMFDQNLKTIIFSSPNNSEPVEIKCIAIGQPIPTLRLSLGDNYFHGTLENDSNQASLTVRLNTTKAEDFGVYTCTAKNELKEVTHHVKVTIQLDKPKIFNVEPGCDFVRFSWRKDAMKNIHVERYEVILKNPDGALVSLKLVPASEQVPQTTFEGLQEKTKYQLSVKQETKFRTIGHTSTENFTTTKCNLVKINAVPTDGNKVILYWPESTQDESYIVKYRIKGNKNWSNQTAGSIRAEVSGLDFGRIYEFQVFTKLGGQEKAYTEVREVKIAEDPTKDSKNKTTTPGLFTDAPDRTSERPPGIVARKKGLSSGAIAAVVIAIILLVLIAVDVFCCFFNQCGVVHLCAAACAGKGRNKYQLEDGTPEEGTKLKAIDGKEDPVA